MIQGAFFFSIFSLFWIVFGRVARRGLRQKTYLKDLPASLQKDQSWPKISIVVPAKNEASSIRQSTLSLLNLNYPNLEIIFVDDRSTDDTSGVLHETVGDRDNVRVITNHELPPDWMGKPHALQLGLRVASGEWVVFTDADVIWGADVLKQTVAHALAHSIDFTTIIFEPILHSWTERAFLMVTYIFGFVFRPPWRVGRSDCRTGFGVGQFCMMRREVLARMGGLERIRLSIPNDMALGDAAKCTGFRCEVLWGKDTFWCRWQTGLWRLIRGVEKNFFAGFQFNYIVALVLLLLIIGLNAGPFLGLAAAIAGGSWLLAGVHLAGLVALWFFCRDYLDQLHPRFWGLLLLPAGALFLASALVWSILYTAWNGGVRWRESLYSQRQVRKHAKEFNRWLAESWRTGRMSVKA